MNGAGSVNPLPLVSCLCVTNGRGEMLKRAIRCFLEQVYGNKELVVVYPSWDQSTQRTLASFDDSRIKPHALDISGLTLGDLRNISMEVASGEYLCNWDDDDWSSPYRIREQYLAIERSKKAASILTRLLIYDSSRELAYLACERLWENSVCFEKGKVRELGIAYPALNRTEDYQFVNALIRHNLVYPMQEPTLYIYYFGGANTSPASLFHMQLKRSDALDAEQSSLVRTALLQEIQPALAHARMQSAQFKSGFRYIRHSAVPRV
jgi:glycosyltransferase involved in cell wall biosynthesis